MPIKRIEALVDAIAMLNDFANPKSKAYQLRNPSLARAFSFKHALNTDESGTRRFTSIIGGFRYAIEDCLIKCKGESRAKGMDGQTLKADSTLADLLYALNQKSMVKMMQAVEFLQQALNDETISTNTIVSYFLEDIKEQEKHG